MKKFHIKESCSLTNSFRTWAICNHILYDELDINATYQLLESCASHKYILCDYTVEETDV